MSDKRVAELKKLKKWYDNIHFEAWVSEVTGDAGFNILNNRKKDGKYPLLGEVIYYLPFDSFCFQPNRNSDIVFAPDCQDIISGFCKELNRIMLKK